MLSRPTYFVKVWRDDNPDVCGIGECAMFPGLSCDDVPEYETVLAETCANIDAHPYSLKRFPSILMGLETAFADLESGGVRRPFPSQWSRGESAIRINGLIWMGTHTEMAKRIREKLVAGFRCIKLKIGAIDFDSELDLIRYLRAQFDPATLEIRLDANGAFSPANALSRLEKLANYHIHSIEQPVKAGQWNAMAKICRESPVAVALDEELIGVNDTDTRKELLNAIRPAYIILKPTLHGGFSGADEWISLAEERGIGWWATSALESNIGLNAIAQWVSAKEPLSLVQGLGTGNLYINNITSPLALRGESLYYNVDSKWSLPQI